MFSYKIAVNGMIPKGQSVLFRRLNVIVNNIDREHDVIL